MLKPVLTLAAAGVLGLALWKILAILFLPLLGLFFTIVKIALVVGLIYLVLWWLHRDKPEEPPTTP